MTGLEQGAGPGLGRFITIEGIDGSGKSTQADILCRRLSGFAEARREFEPKVLRDALLHRAGPPMSSRSELLLFLADRSIHVDEDITPALESGRWVVCERYSDSTLAYQSWGRGIPRGEVEMLLSWCCFPVPDATILLDIGVEAAMRRVALRGKPDRLEADLDMMRRVAEGYAALAHSFPDRIAKVNADAPVEAVADDVLHAVRRLLCPS
ncbi:MAG: dTMP kinase [Synergistaceae bacterium]|jgi:dTMP kinase|nr:dTMP kinase [Synergistaceae bacterium]